MAGSLGCWPHCQGTPRAAQRSYSTSQTGKNVNPEMWECLLEPWALCPSCAKCWHAVKAIFPFVQLMPRGKAGADAPALGKAWAGRGAGAELADPNSGCHPILVPQ